MVDAPAARAEAGPPGVCSRRIRKSSQERIGFARGCCEIPAWCYRSNRMMHLLILAVHLLTTIAKLVRPGGVRAVIAAALLLNPPVSHQSSRTATGSPIANSFDRFLLGLGSLFVPPNRLPKLAVILKPENLAQVPRGPQEKANIGGSSPREVIGAPGPQGPSKALIDANHLS